MGTIMGNGVTIRGGNSRVNKGAQLNIDYGATPPSDTSKLWIPNNGKEPSKIEINDKFMAFGDEVIDSTYSNNMPGTVKRAKAFAIGTKIYIVGGTRFDSTTNNVVKNVINITIYDTITNTFSQSNATIYSTTTYRYEVNLTCCAVGTKIYIFGYGTNDYSNIRIYDTETDTITTIPTSTVSIHIDGAMAIPFGEYIYIFGGKNGTGSSDFIKTVYKYDINKNSLTMIGTGTIPNYVCCSGVIADDKYIYLVGNGIDTAGVTRGTKTVYVYDPATATFTTLTNILPYDYAYWGYTPIGNRLYMFGGEYYYNSSVRIYNTIQVFDTVTRTAREVSSVLPVNVAECACACVGDYIYIFGGINSRGTSNHGTTVGTVYRFNVQTLLEADNMKMFTDMYSRDHVLINSDKVKLYSTIKNAYIGNSEGYAKLVPVYVYDPKTSKWKTIEGIDYTG